MIGQKMFNYGFRNTIFLFKKLRSEIILSSSFNTINKVCLNLNEIRVTSNFIKRDFCQNANKMKTKEEIDNISNQELQTLLNDPDTNKAFKLLQYEVEYMREMNEEVPKVLRPKDWIYLLKTTSKNHIRKHLRFLFINEIKRNNFKEKKRIKVENTHLELEKFNEECPSGLKYGLSDNSLFLRLYDKSLDNFLNFNLAMRAMYEPTIVFDCGYNTVMRNYEVVNCAKQLIYSFVLNRMHNTPAQLYFCNAAPENEIIESFHNMVPNLYDDTFPLNCTSQSYLDMFDKKQLVYLTPHCRKEMTYYDSDKIYIIGAMVDKASPKPYSLAKAKKENLYMEKLPIDRYLNWGTGSTKSLTINQVLGILLDVKYTKDWMAAFRNHIPRRKLKAFNDEENDKS